MIRNIFLIENLLNFQIKKKKEENKKKTIYNKCDKQKKKFLIKHFFF